MKNNDVWFIYKTTCLINGKIYVGQHKSHKMRRLLIDNWYIGSGKILKNAIKKYGKNSFVREILEYCSKDTANDREIYWISKLNSTNRAIGYNIDPGGSGGERDVKYNYGKNHPRYGKHWSEEHKKQQSLRMVGKYTGSKNPNYGNGDKIKGDKNPAKRKEVRDKISAAKIGWKVSEESLINFRLSHLGKKQSEITRKKQSIARMGNTFASKYFYKATSPEGLVYDNIKNLRKFCIDNELNFNGIQTAQHVYYKGSMTWKYKKWNFAKALIIEKDKELK